MIEITAKMHSFAQPVNTLLLWAQSPRKDATKCKTRGVNEGCKPADRIVTSSIAEYERGYYGQNIERGLVASKASVFRQAFLWQISFIARLVSCMMSCPIALHVFKVCF